MVHYMFVRPPLPPSCLTPLGPVNLCNPDKVKFIFFFHKKAKRNGSTSSLFFFSLDVCPLLLSYSFSSSLFRCLLLLLTPCFSHFLFFSLLLNFCSPYHPISFIHTTLVSDVSISPWTIQLVFGGALKIPRRWDVLMPFGK